MSEKPSVLQLKLLILELLDAQSQLSKFLNQCADKYGPVLTADEVVEGRTLMRRVSALSDKVNLYLNRPPDKLPVYHQGGWIHPLRGGAKRCQKCQLNNPKFTSKGRQGVNRNRAFRLV